VRWWSAARAIRGRRRRGAGDHEDRTSDASGECHVPCSPGTRLDRGDRDGSGPRPPAIFALASSAMGEETPGVPIAELRQVLDSVEPRPADDGDRGDKKNYAQRLSRALALEVSGRLRPHFADALPTVDEGHETEIGGAGGTKRLDVCVWDRKRGLLLDVSIKTYSFRDYDSKRKKLGRMTKNVVRNDMELRAEAGKIHERQPFAVLVGLMFVPTMACTDGERDKSSFAHMVLTFRERTGRTGHDDKRFERFELFYLGVYETEAERRGQIRFFDVRKNPPRNGKPRREDTISFDELITEIQVAVDRRNSTGIEWGVAEGEPDYPAS